MMADLADQIEDTRIRYIQKDHGVRMEGSAFICQFDTPQYPRGVVEEISTIDDPWRMLNVSSALADDYWKVNGVLFHVENGELVSSSKIDLEIAPEFVRVYVKEGCSAERAAEFVRALDAEYGVTIDFAQDAEGRGGGA